jgi:hypothetical protein
MTPEDEVIVNQWYANQYNTINATAVKNSLPNRILHELIEKPFKSNARLSILEVGGGAGEHLPFVVDDFKNYLMTDIRPLAGESIRERLRTEMSGGG